MVNTLSRFELLSKLLTTRPTPNPKDVSRLNLRIELHIISPAMPNVTRVAQEVVHLIGIAFHRTKLVDRNVDIGVLFAMRIEVHDHENNVVTRHRHFSVKQNGVVVRLIET